MMLIRNIYIDPFVPTTRSESIGKCSESPRGHLRLSYCTSPSQKYKTHSIYNDKRCEKQIVTWEKMDPAYNWQLKNKLKWCRSLKTVYRIKKVSNPLTRWRHRQCVPRSWSARLHRSCTQWRPRRCCPGPCPPRLCPRAPRCEWPLPFLPAAAWGFLGKGSVLPGSQPPGRHRNCSPKKGRRPPADEGSTGPGAMTTERDGKKWCWGCSDSLLRCCCWRRCPLRCCCCWCLW